jgi:N-acetylglucosaminyldiphosphoundecaprenol N-acetyl-beta-D-mannosaminyltransferase
VRTDGQRAEGNQQIIMRKLLIILGVPIDDLTMSEALDNIERFITLGRRTGRSHQVATINADFVIKANTDPELRRILQEADMATADGMPLVWGARLLGMPLSGRVTGADLVPALAERAAERSYSLYFLGAAPGVAVRAAEVLQARYPALRIAGVASPTVNSLLEVDHALLRTIQVAHPDILLVAFGNPKQEKWINMHAQALHVPVMIGVGGTLDFIAGMVKRAPLWMQKSGLEWLYRLLQEPRRLWKRYVNDLSSYSIFFLRQWWMMRQHRLQMTPIALPSSDLVLIENTAIINVAGRLERSSVARFNRHAHEALAFAPHIIVNLSSADFLDSSGIGALVSFVKQASDQRGDVVLTGVSAPIRKVLSLLHLDTFFEIYADMESACLASGAPTPTPVLPSQTLTGWAVLKMPRRFDAATSAEVIQQCQDALQANVRLVLDFAKTTFLSSAGLAAMLQLSREAQSRGGEVRLASCSGDVLRTIQLTRFDKVLRIYGDVQTAAV